MEGVFSYDEAVADSAHGDLAGVISGLQAHLDDLSGFVARVKSNWEGDEQDIYAGVQAKWDSASETVREILGTVHQALGANTGSVKADRLRRVVYDTVTAEHRPRLFVQLHSGHRAQRVLRGEHRP